MTASGSVTASTPGEVINGLAVSGTIDVTASNVTIENTDVANASSCCWGVRIEPGVTGTVLKYDTIHGSDNASGSLAWAVDNAGDFNSVTEDHVYTYDADRILNGPGTVTNSYCLGNANISGEHYECVYTGEGSVVISHDTLLETHAQTGATWVGPDFGDIDTYTVENSLLAGGGYTLYGAATNSSNPARGVLVGPVTIENNRFSKLYFPKGGYYGADDYSTGPRRAGPGTSGTTPGKPCRRNMAAPRRSSDRCGAKRLDVHAIEYDIDFGRGREPASN